MLGRATHARAAEHRTPAATGRTPQDRTHHGAIATPSSPAPPPPSPLVRIPPALPSLRVRRIDLRRTIAESWPSTHIPITPTYFTPLGLIPAVHPEMACLTVTPPEDARANRSFPEPPGGTGGQIGLMETTDPTATGSRALPYSGRDSGGAQPIALIPASTLIPNSKTRAEHRHSRPGTTPSRLANRAVAHDLVNAPSIPRRCLTIRWQRHPQHRHATLLKARSPAAGATHCAGIRRTDEQHQRTAISPTISRREADPAPRCANHGQPSRRHALKVDTRRAQCRCKTGTGHRTQWSRARRTANTVPFNVRFADRGIPAGRHH